MSKMAISEAHIAIPAGAISQAYVRLRGAQKADISVHHAHTDIARVNLTWGRILFSFLNAQAAQGVLEGFSAARHSLCARRSSDQRRCFPGSAAGCERES